MPIVYKQHLDSRDGTIYPCVLMPDGKWWSSRNLEWDGAGGLYYGNNPSNAFLGRLYPDPNLTGEISPAGAHTPTIAEWNALISAIGGANCNRTLRSTFGWYSTQGEDTYGFRVLGGGFGYNNGASWADGGGGIGSAYYTLIRAVAGSGKFTNCDFYTDNRNMVAFSYSIGVDANLSYSRFIVDTFNEPVPPTKIKGTFSGSGVKVFAAMPSDSTFEVPLWAQSTTELTISKDFITKWGAAIGRVRILVVDGEYISEWKDWDFRI